MVWWILVILVTTGTFHHGGIEASPEGIRGPQTRQKGQDHSPDGPSQFPGQFRGLQQTQSSFSLQGARNAPQRKPTAWTSTAFAWRNAELLEVCDVPQVEQGQCGFLPALREPLGTSGRELFQRRAIDTMATKVRAGSVGDPAEGLVGPQITKEALPSASWQRQWPGRGNRTSQGQWKRPWKVGCYWKDFSGRCSEAEHRVAACSAQGLYGTDSEASQQHAGTALCREAAAGSSGQMPGRTQGDPPAGSCRSHRATTAEQHPGHHQGATSRSRGSVSCEEAADSDARCEGRLHCSLERVHCTGLRSHTDASPGTGCTDRALRRDRAGLARLSREGDCRSGADGKCVDFQCAGGRRVRDGRRRSTSGQRHRGRSGARKTATTTGGRLCKAGCGHGVVEGISRAAACARILGDARGLTYPEAPQARPDRPHQGAGKRRQVRQKWATYIVWAAAAGASQEAPWWGQCVSFRGPHWPIESGLPHLAVSCEHNFMHAHVAELHARNQALEVRLQDLPGLRPHTFLDDTRFEITELEPWEDRFPLARTRDNVGPGLMAKRVTFAESSVESDCIDAASCAVQLYRTGPGILHICPHRLPLQVIFKGAGGNSSGNLWRRQFSQLCGSLWEGSRTKQYPHCGRPWSQPVQVYPCTANVHFYYKQPPAEHSYETPLSQLVRDVPSTALSIAPPNIGHAAPSGMPDASLLLVRAVPQPQHLHLPSTLGRPSNTSLSNLPCRQLVRDVPGTARTPDTGPLSVPTPHASDLHTVVQSTRGYCASGPGCVRPR